MPRPLRIEYLDQSGSKLNGFNFPESTKTESVNIHLLFRPGHYDILYKK